MRPQIQPPTHTTAEKLGDTPEAFAYRQRSAVIKLKKLRVQYADAEELASVWAAVDKLSE